ncbi:hypothetical protein UFOVP384_16 [uncultured Caudovirales phage]|uniref:dATP/dGTP diphosphohydrolase N-terminal domain-containing protein n=1 Tax=uncultured Caudovirales phage TaxID=2100421 RepID=A0A6J7X7H3_9CAUD|nr:hypothetical protein UFOVP384_16 [uncultured Caudovirales phage]
MTITHDTMEWWQKASASNTLEDNSFKNKSNVIDSKRVFESGSQRDDDTDKPLVNHLTAYLRLRFGYLLRIGANKYGKNNWQKGQPTETALESLHRHLAKYEIGDRSEDHLSAIIFNVQLIMKNEEKDGIKIDEYYK